MQLNNTLLRSLSDAIEAGRPINALLRAAEYIQSDDPLWEALVQAARVKLKPLRQGDNQALIASLIKGKRFAEFSPSERARLTEMQRVTPIKNERDFVFHPPVRQFLLGRRANAWGAGERFNSVSRAQPSMLRRARRCE
jgi:hypothetical protein